MGPSASPGNVSFLSRNIKLAAHLYHPDANFPNCSGPAVIIVRIFESFLPPNCFESCEHRSLPGRASRLLNKFGPLDFTRQSNDIFHSATLGPPLKRDPQLITLGCSPKPASSASHTTPLIKANPKARLNPSKTPPNASRISNRPSPTSPAAKMLTPTKSAFLISAHQAGMPPSQLKPTSASRPAQPLSQPALAPWQGAVSTRIPPTWTP